MSNKLKIAMSLSAHLDGETSAKGRHSMPSSKRRFSPLILLVYLSVIGMSLLWITPSLASGEVVSLLEHRINNPKADRSDIGREAKTFLECQDLLASRYTIEAFEYSIETAKELNMPINSSFLASARYHGAQGVTGLKSKSITDDDVRSFFTRANTERREIERVGREIAKLELGFIDVNPVRIEEKARQIIDERWVHGETKQEYYRLLKRLWDLDSKDPEFTDSGYSGFTDSRYWAMLAQFDAALNVVDATLRMREGPSIFPREAFPLPRDPIYEYRSAVIRFDIVNHEWEFLRRDLMFLQGRFREKIHSEFNPSILESETRAAFIHQIINQFPDELKKIFVEKRLVDVVGERKELQFPKF